MPTNMTDTNFLHLSISPPEEAYKEFLELFESSAHLVESPDGTLEDGDFLKVMGNVGPKIAKLLQGETDSNSFTVDEVMRFIRNLTKDG